MTRSRDAIRALAAPRGLANGHKLLYARQNGPNRPRRVGDPNVITPIVMTLVSILGRRAAMELRLIWVLFENKKITLQCCCDPHRLTRESTMQMRNKGLSVVAAVALLASVGAAHAKGPVTLTDSQLDKITAGDATGVLNPLTFWIEVS